MNFCSFKPLKLWECWLQQHNPDYTSVSGLYYFFSVVVFFFFLIPGGFLLTYHIYSLFISQRCGCVKKNINPSSDMVILSPAGNLLKR